MKIRSIFLFILFLFFHGYGRGQIAQGGSPLDVVSLKSGSIPVVYMPAVDNRLLLESSIEKYSEAELPKPFTFASSFKVDLTPSNSGWWLHAGSGYNVWQVRIRSEGALSINLILEPYRLPPGARLFVFNDSKTHIIGAFTDLNNKEFNSLALSPVSGDDIILQYEEPADPSFPGELGIVRVNHDFIGLLAEKNGRRPLGLSGECNIDINCELAQKWEHIKNSVCRLIVAGTEICSGALVNNTLNDKKPYVLSANHCFSDYVNGEQNTVFLFNYESPYCGALDGDISHSVSGSLKVSESDTLDFSLVELSLIPPPEYRPFFAGWDCSGVIPDSVVSIHHPKGDIKKIALDNHSPDISSFGNNSDYCKNGFWKTLRWEYGTTEIGSSGAPYFDQNKRMIGSLTGGVASCSNPVNDYFARFDIAWDHYADSARQLKCWLDPLNAGTTHLDGMYGYAGSLYCAAFTNLLEGDSPELTPMYDNTNEFMGYWAGTNLYDIDEYVEKFFLPGEEVLEGISLGIARLVKNASTANSYLKLRVYNGSQFPEEMIFSQNVALSGLVQDAMNYIPFDEVVFPSDTFFVGFDITPVEGNTTFAVYQAERETGQNTLYYRKNNIWYDYHQAKQGVSASLAFELLACNVDDNPSDTSDLDWAGNPFLLFPNPATEGYINLVWEDASLANKISIDDISVVDILGRKVPASIHKELITFRIELISARAGIYFLRVANEAVSGSGKFYYRAKTY